MILSGPAIGRYVTEGFISINPRYDEKQLRPFGIRVHLAGEILVPRAGRMIDLSHPSDVVNDYSRKSIGADGLTLAPGDFVLAATVEQIKVAPWLCCRLDGRS